MSHIILELPGLLDTAETQGMRHPLTDLNLPAFSLLLNKSDLNKKTLFEVLSLATLEIEGLINPSWGAGYLNLAGSKSNNFSWFRADPMELQPDRIAVYLTGNRHLSLSESERTALEKDVNTVCKNYDCRYFAVSAQEGYFRVNGQTHCDVQFIPAIEALGKDQLETFPKGKDSTYWKQLLTELQMHLHGSPVNTHHTKRGIALINSLYFWGDPSTKLPKITTDFLYSDSNMIKSCAFENGIDSEELPTSWCLQNTSKKVNQFVDMELIWLKKQGLLSAWQQRVIHYEKSWLVPLIKALKKHQIEAISLVTAKDKIYTLRAAHLKRFWRTKKNIDTLIK